jgi:hypothetical protein
MTSLTPKPDTRTLAAIRGMRPGRPISTGDPARCGCHPKPDKRAPHCWLLCGYHEGYDDALHIHAPENVEAPK